MSDPNPSAHTCSELRDAILSGVEPDWARVHLETCAGCKELWEPPLRDALTRAAQSEIPKPDLGAIHAELDRELEREGRGLVRLKSLATPTRMGIALGVVGLLIGLNLLKPRPDLAALPLLELLGPLAITVTLLVLGVRGTLRGPHASLTPTLQTRVLIGLSAGLPLFYFLSHSFLGEVPFVDSEPGFARRAIGCFVFGFGWSLPLSLVLVLLDRNKLAAPSVVYSAGTAGGLSGLIALHLHCPVQHPEHLLLGHFSVALVLLCGWVLLRGRLHLGAR